MNEKILIYESNEIHHCNLDILGMFTITVYITSWLLKNKF